MKDDILAKERIIEAASQLIREQGGAEGLTVRDVAARAGVGVGLINYHFQTKDNLINQCIQRIVGKIIEQFEPLYKSLEMAPIEKLRYLVKQNVAFLINYPGFSRTSIVTDLISPGGNDNSVQTLRAYEPVIRELCGNKLSENDIRVLLHTLISSLQAAFLRKDVLKQLTGFDLAVESQRDAFVDMAIDNLFFRYFK